MHDFHISTKAVLEKDGKILMVQEGKEHVRGQWDLPGGSMKDGETFRECILRELEEETGFEARVEKPIGMYWEKSVRTGRSVLITLFKCSPVKKGERARNQEIMSQKFFKPGEAKKTDLRKPNREEMINDFLQGKEIPAKIVKDTRQQ
ncbi:MAG: NUDIX hydrolase [Candidatus Nanohalobium sp.]